MLPDTLSVSQLSHVISQAAAPAFLLGAIAAFIAILIPRLNRIIDRTIVLNGISDVDTTEHRLKADLPRLMRRTAMLNKAIFWAVISSITVTVLVIAHSRVPSLQFNTSAALPFSLWPPLAPSPYRLLILPVRYELR